MTKLLATTAIALIGFSGVASAQSVLERVLAKIDNNGPTANLAKVNGTFANIAENLGGVGSITVYTALDGDGVPTSTVLSAEQYEAGLAAAVAAAAASVPVPAQPNPADYNLTTIDGQTAYNNAVDAYNTAKASQTTAINTARSEYIADYQPATVPVAGLAGVNGSITNIVDGITTATQTALAGAGVSAVEYNMPTLSWGDMATTALGAVNTGEITLGVNQAVDSAKTTSTAAYSAVVQQLGGSSTQGVLVLNIASNMTGINGSISNTMSEVNGTVGDLSTTALGAVNTGTITSGVNAAVTGIIGTSGTGQN